MPSGLCLSVQNTNWHEHTTRHPSLHFLQPHSAPAPPHNSSLPVKGSIGPSEAYDFIFEHIEWQGRESEWIFGSEEGQRQLAEQCSCKRLIVVSLGRGHIFGSSQGVQSEVSALVRHLTPSTVRAVEKGVPIMTCQDGVGKRSLIASVTSPVSG